MKVSELIEILTNIKERDGDLDITLDIYDTYSDNTLTCSCITSIDTDSNNNATEIIIFGEVK